MRVGTADEGVVSQTEPASDLQLEVGGCFCHWLASVAVFKLIQAMNVSQPITPSVEEQPQKQGCPTWGQRFNLLKTGCSCSPQILLWKL